MTRSAIAPRRQRARARARAGRHWPRRALRLLWQGLVATATALAVVLIASRINPAPYDPDPPIDPILTQPIADVRIDASSLPRAVASLRKATATPIRFDQLALESAGWQVSDRPVPPPTSPSPGATAPPSNNIRLRNMTLGHALAELFRAVGGRQSYQLGYRVEEGAIVIDVTERAAHADGQRCLRVYDVRDLAADCQRWPERQTDTNCMRGPDRMIDGMEAMQMLLHERVATLGWDGPDRGRIGAFGQWIWVDAPPEVQWDVQRLLFLLRTPRPITR